VTITILIIMIVIVTLCFRLYHVVHWNAYWKGHKDGWWEHEKFVKKRIKKHNYDDSIKRNVLY